MEREPDGLARTLGDPDRAWPTMLTGRGPARRGRAIGLDIQAAGKRSGGTGEPAPGGARKV